MNETIKQIDEIRDYLMEGKIWRDGEQLSMAVVKLAGLNSYLGEYVAQSELDASTAEAHYKVMRDSLKLDKMKDGSPANKAESEALIESQSLLDEANQRKYESRLISTKRTDTNNLIDACRSRLSFIKSEMNV